MNHPSHLPIMVSRKKQMVLVIVDPQRPMHRSVHVRKAGDCLLKKKKADSVLYATRNDMDKVSSLVL